MSIRIERLGVLACLIASIALTTFSGTASAYDWHVNDDATLYNLSVATSVQAGDRILLGNGPFRQQQIFSFQGSATAPITIMPDGTATPVVLNSFFLSGAQDMTVTGLTFQQCPNQWGGVVLQGDTTHNNRGAANNIIAYNDISSCGGIWFWGRSGTANNPSAGPNNVISNNVIHDNAGAGIWVDGSTTILNTTISGNSIHDNGGDGIVLTSSDTLVEHNIVYHNGQQMAGTSGIRTDGNNGNDAGSPSGLAQNNIIRYNVIYGQSAHGYPADGAGIELDLYSKGNQVYFNDVHFNDGAGIELIAAEANWIFNNTLHHNVQATQTNPAELSLGGSAADQATLGSTTFSGQSINNIVANNLVLPTSASVPHFGVGSGSIENTLENQLFVPFADGSIKAVLWGTDGFVAQTWTSISAWNTAKGGIPDIAADPLFLNPSAETATTGLAKNLSLSSTSSPAYQAGLSPLNLPTPITVTLDLWRQLTPPSSQNIDPNHPPIGAYTVDP